MRHNFFFSVFKI